MTLNASRHLIDPAIVGQIKANQGTFRDAEIKRLGIHAPDRLPNVGLAHMQFMDWWDKHLAVKQQKADPEVRIMLSFLDSMYQKVILPSVAAWAGSSTRVGPEAQCTEIIQAYLASGEKYFNDLARKVTDRDVEAIKAAYRREQQVEWDMLSQSLERAYEETRVLERKLISQAERHEQHLRDARAQYEMELARVQGSSREKALQEALEKARKGQQMQLERHNAEIRALKAEIANLKKQAQEPAFYTFESSDATEVMSLALYSGMKMPSKGKDGQYHLTVQTTQFTRWRTEVKSPAAHVRGTVKSTLKGKEEL